MVSQGMVSLTKSLCTISPPRVHFKNPKMMHNYPKNTSLPHLRSRSLSVSCSKLSQWEPIVHASAEDADGIVIDKPASVFDSIVSDKSLEEDVKLDDDDAHIDSQIQILKWPIWLLGPSVLLTSGMAPTLWIPLSSVFLGSNVVSLLSLIGLDCIFNLGATLFLLMADSCARPKDSSLSCNSKPPFSYKFWNLFALTIGFFVPMLCIFGSQSGLLLEVPFLSSAVLLLPYFILLAVQTLTEILVWHWESPVWLVTPVIYEAYRVLQLMRGLKLSAEVNAPVWVAHMLRGLVSWWVLILGMQLMRVAWFAGFASKQKALSVASK